MKKIKQRKKLLESQRQEVEIHDYNIMTENIKYNRDYYNNYNLANNSFKSSGNKKY